MENPATTSGQTPKAREESRTAVFLRAMFSAAVFGAIGAWLGSTLGKYGNGKGRDMAQPIMKWSMGGFWALVAAYCSLKADEPKPATPAAEATVPPRPSPQAYAPRTHAAPTVDASTSEHQGALHETHAKAHAV